MKTVDLGRPETARADLPAVGPLSEQIAGLLSSTPGDGLGPAELVARFEPLLDSVEDPLGDDDLHLALYLCYELHYRAFEGVHPAWEWNPALLAGRACLETAFFGALDEEVPGEAVNPDEVGDILFQLSVEGDQVALARHLASHASLDEYREFVANCSLFRLKESDPHCWAAPRLTGAAKTALMKVLNGKYGSGDPERVRSHWFARTMRALGLDDRENAYLGYVPGVTLAGMNLMSGIGLHRSRRGASVGHLAMLEMTSYERDRRHCAFLQRFDLVAETADCRDERVEAEVGREGIPAYGLVEALVRQEPALADDVVFGARALVLLEGRFAQRLLSDWRAGRSPLRQAPAPVLTEPPGRARRP